MNNKAPVRFRFPLGEDSVINRLRLVMAGAIMFSILNTLAGQPAAFWRNPEAAVRGDGLALHNPVNHIFEFGLSHGWLPFALWSLLYLALAFALVSVLPGKAAYVASFSFIFGHFYGAGNWLAVGWRLGFNGAAAYGLALSASIAWGVSPIPPETGDRILRRLRWVMVGVMLFDPLVTLLGEPGSYWARPQTVHEGNPFWRWIMMRGWLDYILMDLAYCAGAFWLASILPRFFAIMTIFAFIFGHFIGASNWFFYDWRLGMETPVIYGVVLSFIIVSVSSRLAPKPKATAEFPAGPLCPARSVCRP